VILRTDVMGFYPNVRPVALFDALLGLGVPAEVARTAAGLLEGWGSDGYAGLPIGPPGSAIMANAVLTSIDGALAPRPFLRWVDDYLVSATSVEGADELLERLDEALGRVGLCRSSSKTTLLEPGPGLRWLGASGG
jgi:Reverse transcriptase (RNA-dependent DNA polymerase)